MNGWKLLRKEGRTSVGHRHSKWNLCYPVGETVTPKLEGSLLFFFKDKQDASNFADRYFAETVFIVPCIAKGCYKAKYMSRPVEWIGTFWKVKRENRKQIRYEKYNREVDEVPQGTWFAKSITCLE